MSTPAGEPRPEGSRPRARPPIPADQAWFFAPDWEPGELEAEQETAAGHGIVFSCAYDMFAYLATLGAAEA